LEVSGYRVFMGRTEVDAALLLDTFNLLIGYAVGKNVSPLDAEELALGAVAELTEAWNEGLVDASNIKALAIREITGSISNHKRKEAGRKTIEASTSADFFNRTTEGDFSNTLTDRMAIQKALEQISEPTRSAIVLAYLCREPQVSVAKMLSLRPDQVTRMLDIGLGQMRLILNEGNQDD
jgi:DNA-directed RNA polymerase specialized sigma24 family protein